MPSGEKREETRHPSRSIKRIARTMMGVIGLFIVFLLVAWWRLVSDDAVVTIPNPVMPSPNAFDFYLAAGRSVVNTKQIDAAIMQNPIVPMTPAQKEALVRQNAGALQSLHQGFAYEYCNPPVRSVSARMPQYALFRRITPLLELQNQVREARGDWDGAAESELDAIRLGEDIPHGGGLGAHSVGIACEMNGQRPMWETIAHLNTAQSRAAAQRLEAIMRRHFSYADTIQEEKWTGQAILKEYFRTIKPRRILSDSNDIVGGNASASRRFSTAYYLLYGKKRILKDYTEFLDAVSEGVRKPYALKMLPPPKPDDPITDVMLPMFWNRRFSDVNARAQNGLLLVALALHAYRLESGRYPTSLAELAPTYLKKVPDDPFAMQGTFAYRVKGTSYVLYSIGPDGKDDGGTPIDDPKSATTSNPQARYRVKEDSAGDIVAGINLP